MDSRYITYNTVESLKNQTSISQNVDPNSLLPYLQSGEMMHVLPIIGQALDSQLKQELISNTLSGDNYTLVYEYIQPVSSYASWYDASTFLNVKTTAKGLVQQSSDNSQNIDFELFKHYRQSIQDKLTFFERRLEEYLNTNASLFPQYRSDNNCSTIHNHFSSGIKFY